MLCLSTRGYIKLIACNDMSHAKFLGTTATRDPVVRGLHIVIFEGGRVGECGGGVSLD